jgi:hypothetical protein
MNSALRPRFRPAPAGTSLTLVLHRSYIVLTALDDPKLVFPRQVAPFLAHQIAHDLQFLALLPVEMGPSSAPEFTVRAHALGRRFHLPVAGSNEMRPARRRLAYLAVA